MRRVNVRLDGTSPRRWHLRLIERLAARRDCDVRADARPGPGGLPANAALLFRLEETLKGLPRPGPSTLLDPGALARYEPAFATPDLVIDLCGDGDAAHPQVWRLRFDGHAGEAALLAALLDGRTPVATVVERETVVAAARLGTESRGTALASFEDGLARCVTLLLAALDGGAVRLPAMGEAAATPETADPLSLKRLARKTATLLAGTVAHRLYHLCYHAPHWRVGWRRIVGEDLFALQRHPDQGWTDLPDDGSRFYADPFPLEHDGTTTLFVEDFIHSLGKGVISAVAFGPEGPVGRPVPVLERHCHLSYPFVFEAEGSVWMIPESCAERTVDLYRAYDYPGGWRLEATLVGDIVASDATLLRHGDRWWMFATVQDEGGSYSDTLYLWSAPDFRGPWTPQRHNPVLIDTASARPAGRFVERDGVLFRPVQDCRLGYGAALGLARVSRLDDDGYEQTVDTVLRSGAAWPGRRIHSLNSAGGLEFIDGSAWARRRLRRRPAA